MLLKLKNMPGVAWLVIGFCIAALLLPTAAVAAGITWSGIEGQNKNKADVTEAGQLETSPADINSAFQSNLVQVADSGPDQTIWSPPSGSAGVITSIHASLFDFSGDEYPYLVFEVGNVADYPNSTFEACSLIYANLDTANAPGDGTVVLPFSPGYVLPPDEELCAYGDGYQADVTVNGYTVPAADAPTLPQAPATLAPLTQSTS